MIHNIVVGQLRDGVLLEAEHNRIRRELFDPFCEQIARVQFAV